MTTSAHPVPPAPTQGPPVPVQPQPKQTWGAGRITAMIVGVLILLGSLALAFGGLTLAVASATLRDDDGFLMSGEDTFSTATYAMTTGNMEIHAEGAAQNLPHNLLGDAKITATPNGDAPVFVGIAPTADVARYLRGVGHATFVGFQDEFPAYRMTAGEAPKAPPTASDIWVAKSAGEGAQSVTWPVDTGNWTVVVMNADGSRGVSADLAAGATVPAFGWVVTGILVTAAVGLVISLTMIVLAARTRPATRG